jgi:DNA-binding transcriptional LysR family regulator
MFNLFFLKTFVVLARTKSFRATALANSITQSAVSQQIRALETRLHCRLIERSSKEIRLSPQGQIFLAYAEDILKRYDDALMHLNKHHESMEGVIRVATIYSVGLYRLQPMIRRFLKKHPKVNIHLEYYHNNLIYEKVASKLIDFGFVAIPKPSVSVKAKCFAEDPLVLIQCTQRPIFARKTIGIHELNNSRYVALARTTPTGKEIQEALKKSGVNLLAIHEFENVETLKSAVLVGMGCAFVPANVLDQELRRKELEVVKIRDFRLSRSLGVIYSPNNPLTIAKQKFFNIFAGA